MKNIQLVFPVKIVASGGGYLVEVSHPEAQFQGVDFAENKQEAHVKAVALLDAILEYAMEHDEAVPAYETFKHGKGTVAKRVSAYAQLKYSLYCQMKERKCTKAQLARLLGWKYPQVDRLLKASHASRLDQFQAAAHALGMEVQATIVPPTRH